MSERDELRQIIDCWCALNVASRESMIDALFAAGFHKDDPEWDGIVDAHPAYWRGETMGVHGAAMRWEEALTEPMPKPGVMNEPLESLYRRTEALRKERDAAIARAEKCEADWELDLLKHTTMIRAERDALAMKLKEKT